MNLAQLVDILHYICIEDRCSNSDHPIYLL
jgi:hypothetical protein